MCERAQENISDSWSHLLQTVKLLIAMSIFRKLTVEFSFAKAELKLKGYNSTDASLWYSFLNVAGIIHNDIVLQIILADFRLAKQ